jgi:threonine dehydratase
MQNNDNLPTRADVLAAAERIAGLVEQTPLIKVSLGGHQVWLKCESMQTGGSFKLRGASNRLALLSETERKAGVVAFSSGNHAQGVAIAAHRLGVPATIVMPTDAPAPKVAGTRAHGAEIIFYDRASEDRVAIARTLAAERGAVVVPSFDDSHIIAGQGTTGNPRAMPRTGAADPRLLRRWWAGGGDRARLSGRRDNDGRARGLG